MNIIAHDKFLKDAKIKIEFFNGDEKTFTIETKEIDNLLSNSILSLCIFLKMIANQLLAQKKLAR